MLFLPSDWPQHGAVSARINRHKQGKADGHRATTAALAEAKDVHVIQLNGSDAPDWPGSCV